MRTFQDFFTASIIGNTFDYGVQGAPSDQSLPDLLRPCFLAGLFVDDTDRMIPLLDRIVYITDNCGEIVFDRLLIDHLVARGVRVTLAVRDRPVLNDATLEDALALGLDIGSRLLTTTGGDGDSA